MAVVSTFIPQFPLPPGGYDQRDQTELRANMRAALTGVVVAIAELDEQIGAAYPTQLDDLTDVSLTALGDDEILLSSSGVFINRTFAEAGISEVGHTHVHTDITDFDAEVNALIAAKDLEYLNDVAAYDTLAAGELLEWSGSAWVHQTKAEAGISEIGHGHTVSDISDFATEVDSAINTHEYMDFFNGTFIEHFSTTLTEAAGVVTANIEKSGGGDLTARFSSGEVTIDCTPTATIALTVGTDAAPQTNYVYVLESTGAITKSTSGWPSAEHVKIAFFLVPSATFVAANGAYVHQNWNDHAAGSDNMGHVAHMAERSRRDGAYWFSGLDGAGTSDYLTISGTTVDFAHSTGVAYQMHKHTFPAFDTALGNVVLVKNWSGDAYHDITNLYDIVADSTGSTITNNRWFSLIVWAVANNTGTYHPVIINLPSGTYTSQSQAEADLSSYADYSVPREFDLDSSTAVLLCRIVVQKQSSTWAYGSTVDLRGLNDAIAAGGGGGGGASATEFSDAVFRVFDDSDNTKQLAFQVSGLTTATTRTLTIPDASGTIELEGHTHVEADITDLGPYEDYLGLPASDGYILSSTAAGVRSWIANSATVTALEDVGDVAAYSALGANEILQWSGSAWVHQTLAEASISEVGHTHVEADITDLGDYADQTGTETISGDWTFSNDINLGTIGDLGYTGALAYFESSGSLELTIDNDNNSTAHYFDIRTDGAPGAGTHLFRINDEGDGWILDDFSIGGTAAAPIGTLGINGSDIFLEADNAVVINIDRDNTGTTATFQVANNGTGPSGGNDLFVVEESGRGWFENGLGVHGTAYTTPALDITDIGSNDMEIETPLGSMYLRSLGSTTATGDGVYLDDGGTNKAKVAAVKDITATATAPTGDYPYGTLHLIY